MESEYRTGGLPIHDKCSALELCDTAIIGLAESDRKEKIYS